MKILICLLLLAATLTEAADPILVDRRYTITWTDPNPSGAVVLWNVYATNTLRTIKRQSRVTSMEAQSLFQSVSNGTYSIFIRGVSETGEEGDSSVPVSVNWRLKPGAPTNTKISK